MCLCSWGVLYEEPYQELLLRANTFRKFYLSTSFRPVHIEDNGGTISTLPTAWLSTESGRGRGACLTCGASKAIVKLFKLYKCLGLAGSRCRDMPNLKARNHAPPQTSMLQTVHIKGKSLAKDIGISQ